MIIPLELHRESLTQDAQVEFRTDAAAEPGDLLPGLVRLLIALNRRLQERRAEPAAGEEDK